MLYLLLLAFLGQRSPAGASFQLLLGIWTLSIGLRSWEREIICVPFISAEWEVHAARKERA